VPHLVRRRVSADHRVLLPCVFFFGGALLALCDALGRVLIAPAEIPAGAMLALIGGPYLVWVVRQRKPLEEV
jgi:ABC-type Fe3+-siderophore transport system permease subunit